MVYVRSDVIISLSRVIRSNSTPFVVLNITGGTPFMLMLLFAVVMNPRSGLISRGRSDRNPSHSYDPVPGTGSRPVQLGRLGVSADACHEILPSTSPQIRFSVACFQYIAASRNSRQSFACAN